MKRRIARKILKRIGHKVRMVSGCEVHLSKPNHYRQSTIDRAIIVRGTWGVLDLESMAWMGNNDGPFVFDDEYLAKVKRQLIAAQIPCDPLRFSVRPYISATIKLDEIALKNNFEQALALIQERGY